MSNFKLLKFEDVDRIDRGNGATTFPLVGRADGTSAFTAGVSSFQPGVEVPLHSHNVEEMVNVLEGSGECEVDGQVYPVKQWDTTYIPAGLVHCFRNTGSQRMSIMWIYATTNVTRTFAATGETVQHLSDQDKVSK